MEKPLAGCILTQSFPGTLQQQGQSPPREGHAPHISLGAAENLDCAKTWGLLVWQPRMISSLERRKAENCHKA